MVLPVLAVIVVAWLVIAVALALLIGRATRIADIKHADELFLRDALRSPAPVHH